MLTRLTIKNLTLFKDIDLQFRSGLTVITGETGSGKSLFASAFSLLAGAKIGLSMLRGDANIAFVEGDFLLEDNSESLILRREIRRTGRSRAFINDSPVSQREFNTIVKPLMDITAQRSFSRLLNRNLHIEYLDAYCGVEQQRTQMNRLNMEFSQLTNKIQQINSDLKNYEDNKKNLEFQLREFTSISPEDGEYEKLKDQLNVLENQEDLLANTERFISLLYDSTDAVDLKLEEASELLANLIQMDASLKDLRSDFEDARVTLREIVSRVTESRHRISSFDVDLEKLRDRQHQLTGLIRKYGGSFASMMENWQSIESQLDEGSDLQERLQVLLKDKSKLVAEWTELAVKVSKIRNSKKEKLVKAIENSLKELGIPDVNFEITSDLVYDENGLYSENGISFRMNEFGIDDVQFRFSANKGIVPKSLSEVASGGELSRLMLSIKQAMPGVDRNSTVLFDEIDTGISGRVARLVGIKLKQLAQERQLIAITHLPQIAALADNHYKIKKTQIEETTSSELFELNHDESINEIAILLSDGNLTEAAVEQAKELMNLERND